MILGIDASNSRVGGGVTYLVELLRVADPIAHGIKKVIVWAPQVILDQIDNRLWLEKRSNLVINEGHYLKRALWQRNELGKELLSAQCDMLFVPGGSFATSFRPIVTASLNLLPFELPELLRYGASTMTIKLFLLRISQSHSFRKADGVIFLSDYARMVVMRLNKVPVRNHVTIPFGITSFFFQRPRPARLINECSSSDPFRLVYISSVEPYKHQWNLVEAVAKLRQETGWEILLEMNGASGSSMALKYLHKSLQTYDPDGLWCKYYGVLPFNELPLMLNRADAAVFASSCENLPNILLEKMASGLPIACSDRGPMPEVLKDGGIYYNPEHPEEIAHVLLEMLASPSLRSKFANVNYERSLYYSWQRCAHDTFEYFAKLGRHYKRSSNVLNNSRGQ